MRAETMESAAADADAAPLDLLLTDAALGVLNRVNPPAPGAAAGSGAGRPAPRRSARVQQELAEVRAEQDTRVRTGQPAAQRQYDAAGLIDAELAARDTRHL